MHSQLSRYASGQLRAEMARRDMTNLALAELLGPEVTAMWVSRRRSGVVPMALDELQRIAEVLELPVSYFIRPERVSA